MLEYPKWRFHVVHEAVIVQDAVDEDARTPSTEGWVNHPSEFPPPVPVKILGEYADAQSAIEDLLKGRPTGEPTAEPEVHKHRRIKR